MQSLPWTRSLRAALIGTLVVCAPFLLMMTGQAGASIVAVYLCQAAMPIALCLLLMWCGLLPALVCLAVGAFCASYTAGALAGALCALFLLSVLGAFCACVVKRVPFWKTVAAVAGAQFLAQLAIFVLLQQTLGGDLYSLGARALVEGLRAAPEGDGMLYQLYQMGVLSLPAEFGTAFSDITVLKDGAYVLTDAVREEFLSAVYARARLLLLSYVPTAMVSQSITGAVLGVSLSIYFGRRAARRRAFKYDREEPEVPDLGMPELAKWHLPRGMGMRVGALAVGYLVTSFSQSETLAFAGAMMYVAFSAVYSIQGLAVVNFTQKQRGTGAFWRKVTLVALYLLSQQFQVLLILGVLDQALNIRKLRPPRERPAE